MLGRGPNVMWGSVRYVGVHLLDSMLEQKGSTLGSGQFVRQWRREDGGSGTTYK